VRLREFKERQRLDEVAQLIPLWFGLTVLLGGATTAWNTMTNKQKKDSATWFKNNYNNNKATVKKVLPYLTPGYGTAISPNTKIGVEKLKPIINKPENFNIGIDNKPLPQPGNINKGKNKDIKNTQPTPLVQPDGSTGPAPSVLDNITSWFKDTFSSDTKKTAPVTTVDKTVLPSIDSKTKKVNPAYKVPVISKPVDNGDGTVTWNGQVYDKVFDKTKIAQINKSIIDNQKRRQQGSYVPPTNIDTKIGNKNKSVGVDGSGAGAVSGGAKDRGSAGGAFGNPGIGGEIGNTGVSGGKDIDVDGTVKGQIGGTDSVGSAGTTKDGVGTVDGTKTIPKGYAAPVSNVKVEPLAKVVPNTIARTGTMPPGYMPPPIAQIPKGEPKFRKYDPKKDTDIIYKGKVAPKNVLDTSKYQKSGKGSGFAQRLQGK